MAQTAMHQQMLFMTGIDQYGEDNRTEFTHW